VDRFPARSQPGDAQIAVLPARISKRHRRKVSKGSRDTSKQLKSKALTFTIKVAAIRHGLPPE